MNAQPPEMHGVTKSVTKSRWPRRAVFGLAAGAGASLLVGASPVQGAVAAPLDVTDAAARDFALEAADPLAASLNGNGRAESVAANTTASGASGANIAYEQGQTPNWFIEEQRNARDAIVAGLVRDNHAAIAAGFQMIAWGEARQAEDGSFVGTRDAFHSTSFFVEATAHALLCVNGSPHTERYAAEAARYTPMLARAVGWMTRPDVWEPGVRANTPYTHRRYIIAAALGLTMRFTGNDDARPRMEEMLRDAFALQSADGNNPEKGGADSSYHMVGLCYAERWATYLADDPLAPQMRDMIERSLAWEAGRILPDGEVDTTDNTRTAGQETTRMMTTKNVAYTQVVRGFLYWGQATANPTWVDLGRRVAEKRGYLPAPRA